MSFYINKLVITGTNKKDSTIIFTPNLNIIYGPSNTGKSIIQKSINYMFGSSKDPFDSAKTGYTIIHIFIKFNETDITMTRSIGANKIYVSSEIQDIPSGFYSTNTSAKYEKTISSVWLYLLGIKNKCLINANANFKKRTLTIGTIKHFFMIDEKRIITDESILLSENKTQNTAEISALLYLLTDNNYSNLSTTESKEIKAAKKKAISQYINKELESLTNKQEELSNAIKNELANQNIKEEINKLSLDITKKQNSLQSALTENKQIVDLLNQNNEKLSENKTLFNRYIKLSSQYKADLNRLNFVVDGISLFNYEQMSICPFCNNEIKLEDKPNYIEAATEEYKKIQLQQKDLEEVKEELKKEITKLEYSNQALINQKSKNDLLIKEFQLSISDLKGKLEIYEKYIEYTKELSILKQFALQKNLDLVEIELEQEEKDTYKVKELISEDFITNLCSRINSLLTACRYHKIASLSFELGSMDIIINSAKKGVNGKGYNAFLNSIISISLARYMHENAKYPPNLLIIDSPILSIKEPKHKGVSQSMKSSLFQNLVEFQNEFQTIIIENEIPHIDYKDTNLIQFTKDVNDGRYGLLYGVTDGE